MVKECMEIFGIKLGLTLSSKTLRAQIEQQGWEVGKIKFDSKLDRYTVEAKSPTGEKITRNGRTERLALSNILIFISHRQGSIPKLARWQTTFTDQIADIAEAYSKAPLYEPKASTAFMELAHDSERRAAVLSQHLSIQVVSDPEPYTSAEKLSDDVKKKRQLLVSRAGADHPIWSEKQVIDYRICHDVLGYVAADAGWDWPGENLAFAHHAQLISAEAQKALFSESIAQAAYAIHYRAYGQQKVALFPQFVDKAQKIENPHAKYPGIHPSQTSPPVVQPHVKHIVESSLGLFGSDDSWTLQRVAVLGDGNINPNLLDPNAGYQGPGGQPTQAILTPDGRTLEQAHGDPMQRAETSANANLINTNNAPSTNGREWSMLNQEDPGELAIMKRAIVNAFRVVLLSPRKDLRWNAVHYQDISNVPAEVDDPAVYWNTLEKSRQDWNVARGFGQYDHVPYMKLIPNLVNVLYQQRPNAGYKAAQDKAAGLIRDWLTEEQNLLMKEDEDKPEAKRREGFQIETKANYNLTARLKLFLDEAKSNLDHAMTKGVKKQFKEEPMDMNQFIPMPIAASSGEDDLLLDKAKYGAFMGNHLKSIAAISQHADALLQAALEDVHEHDGTGHHFRAMVLQMGVPGVGPKVCSFAWLLLQPMTSELATIDTHMMDLLGHTEKEMNNRDYFGMERQLQAGRDAAGYSDVPLGQFQWGMWDYKRTGAGVHQDHSAMSVLDPKPHSDIDWAAKEQPIGAAGAVQWKNMWQTTPPEWWAATKDARDAAWDDFKKTTANKVGKNKVPFGTVPADYDPSIVSPDPSTQTATIPAITSAEAFTGMLPWFTHPSSGERLLGYPGQSLMSHLTGTLNLSPQEIWATVPDEAVGKDPQTPW